MKKFPKITASSAEEFNIVTALLDKLPGHILNQIESAEEFSLFKNIIKCYLYDVYAVNKILTFPNSIIRITQDSTYINIACQTYTFKLKLSNMEYKPQFDFEQI